MKRTASCLCWLGLALLGTTTSCNRVTDSAPTLPIAVVSAESLQQTIEDTLRGNLNKRLLNAERNGAWQVIHGAVAYGEDLPLQVDNKEVRALDFLLGGGSMQGWEISLGKTLPSTQRPGIVAKLEAGSFIGQGHTDQWIGYFSQIPLPLNRQVVVDQKKLTIEDWARQVQWDVPNNPFQEYSWTLIALTNYFPDETKWMASDGREWTLEPLVRYEAQQDLSESPCGGMHRLMGLAHAVRYRQRLKGKMDEGWLMAKQAVDQAIEQARAYQNADGSFSTHYTDRPGTSADISLCISATGHTLEFLSYALDEEQLSEAWMERAAQRLCNMLKAAENTDLECGGIYHALAGLKRYHQRRFRAPSPTQAAAQ